MHFLKSPITWVLLILGIWLNCGYNYRVMQYQGVDAVTAPMLFQQALIGSAVLVAIVCGLALLRGEKFSVTEPGEKVGSKATTALLLIILVIVGGFLLNGGINLIDPPHQ